MFLCSNLKSVVLFQSFRTKIPSEVFSSQMVYVILIYGLYYLPFSKFFNIYTPKKPFKKYFTKILKNLAYLYFFAYHSFFLYLLFGNLINFESLYFIWDFHNGIFLIRVFACVLILRVFFVFSNFTVCFLWPFYSYCVYLLMF